MKRKFSAVLCTVFLVSACGEASNEADKGESVHPVLADIRAAKLQTAEESFQSIMGIDRNLLATIN